MCHNVSQCALLCGDTMLPWVQDCPGPELTAGHRDSLHILGGHNGNISVVNFIKWPIGSIIKSPGWRIIVTQDIFTSLMLAVTSPQSKNIFPFRNGYHVQLAAQLRGQLPLSVVIR